jgi:hypothetical protein
MLQVRLQSKLMLLIMPTHYYVLLLQLRLVAIFLPVICELCMVHPHTSSLLSHTYTIELET